MTRHAFAAVAGLLVLLAACHPGSLIDSELVEATEPPPGWRGAEEGACIERRRAYPSATIVQVAAIRDPDGCGMEYPLRIVAFVDSTVSMKPEATLGCPVTEALEAWFIESVQPAAVAHLGARVEIEQLSNYACRRPRGYRPGQLSEHAYGNALDIAAFRLASGRVVTVQQGWRGRPDEQAFLREIAVTGCRRFRTFLGPGVAFHHNHFHVDLTRRDATGRARYCRPLPDVAPPARTPIGDTRVIVSANNPGELLTEMPADVAREIADPFGVQQSKTAPAAD